MSDKEIFEGDINRIKAWIHFKEGGDVDEDTQLLINDVKLLFDMIAERDAKIKELENRLSDAIDLLYGSSDLPKDTINEILMLEEIRR